MTPALPEAGLGPNLTVILNLLSTMLLVSGFVAIRRRNIPLHRRLMICALISSTTFLVVYLVNHAINGSTPYPFHDWTRTLYFVILIPHTILAGLLVPFILRGVYLAWRARFDRHARLMRWVWPVWVYVSITGVTVYVMLYLWPHWRV